MAQRIEWIDTLRGLGIISVVAGHIFVGKIVTFIYLFHMPLFFFLGGYLLSPSSDIGKFVKKKTIHLIVPYCSFLILLYITQLLVEKNEISIAQWPLLFIKAFLGGVLLTKWTGVFWFVTCFFIVQQLMNFFVKNLTSSTIFCLMLLFLIISYMQSYFFKSFWLPWAIHIVPAAAPIFYLGYLFKNKKDIISLPILIAVLFLLILISSLENGNSYEMKANYYGIPFITLLSSLSIIYLLFLIAQNIQHWGIFNLWMKTIGNASMTIMYLHQAVQYMLMDYFNSPAYLSFVFAVLLPIIVHNILSKNIYTQFLFLGQRTNKMKKI